jgi:hypothetical protein
VREIWRAFGLKPWRADSFKISPDPDLVEKIRDLVGLYMSPPVAAAVFAIDEKPQIQALNRTAPTLPMLPTTPQRATHDSDTGRALNVKDLDRVVSRAPTRSRALVRDIEMGSLRVHSDVFRADSI